jgi:cyclophilin family peptidyl-prolyl cis-trans isomerase
MQLFFNYRDNAFLDGQGFAPFGKVTHGFQYLTELTTSKDGAGAPSQGRITSEGNKYLLRKFPKLSYIANSAILPS